MGMFSNGKSIPCVGVSFGVERLFSIIKNRANLNNISANHTDVFVMAFGGGEGWNGFLKKEWKSPTSYGKLGSTPSTCTNQINIRKQFDAAEKAGAKLAVILGKEEYPQGQLRIKVLGQERKTKVSWSPKMNYLLLSRPSSALTSTTFLA